MQRGNNKGSLYRVRNGHNSKRFDMPIFLRQSANEVLEKLKRLEIWFADSLSLFDHLVKSKHEAVNLSNGQSCSLNESAFYERLFQEHFDAHDALQDATALHRILFASPLHLSEEDIISHCKPISCVDALVDCRYLDKRHELLQTLKGKLYGDSTSDHDRAVSKSMAEKIAGSGLNFDDLQRLFAQFGKKGLVAVLSRPPTSHKHPPKPRVTKTPRILSSILKYFTQRQHEE